MWVPQWLAVLGGAGLVVLLVVLGLVAQYGGVEHAWDEYQADKIAFDNTTDAVLCAGDGDRTDLGCALEIKPRGTSKWSTSGCIDGQTVTVYDPATGTELYRRSAECGFFDGARIVINLRNGAFVVADNLLPAEQVAEATSIPDTVEATVTP